MTVRLTAPEIQELLSHGLADGSAKRFKGGADYTVIVRFSKQPGADSALIEFEPPGSRPTEHFHIPESHDLTELADRIDYLIYQDTVLRPHQ